MKIIDRTAFLAMPAGTLFSKYAPCYFENLSIKEGTLVSRSDLRDDFLAQPISDAIEHGGSEDFSDKLCAAQVGGVSLAMDFQSLMRDGCFDNDQLFAVWERADVEALIARLQETLE